MNLKFFDFISFRDTHSCHFWFHHQSQILDYLHIKTNSDTNQDSFLHSYQLQCDNKWYIFIVKGLYQKFKPFCQTPSLKSMTWTWYALDYS